MTVPAKVFHQIHRWLGRALALLGIAQIPLGLTLYGSPKSLFILFAVGAFAWLFLFFVLSYRYDEGGNNYESDYDSRGSYVSGPSVVEDRRHTSLGRTAAAAAAGVGLANLFRHRSRGHAESEAQGSYVNDKYSEDRQKTGWGKRLLEIGAIGGAAAFAKSIFDRRRDRESDTESGRYRPAHAHSDSMTDAGLSRVEEGRVAPGTQEGPYMHPGRRPSHSSIHSSYYTQTEDEHSHHGVRDAILGAGAFAAVRNLFKRRKDGNSEQQRVEEIRRQDLEEERIARANSKKKYTGDGFYPRRQRPSNSVPSSDLTSEITPHPPRSGEHMVSGAIPVDIPPVPPAHRHTSGSATATDLEAAAAGAAVGAAAGSSSRRRRSSSNRRRREDVASPPVSVKVKMHNDGRHVTLRRLTEEEAASAKRRERDRRGSSRRGSASSLSGNEGGAGSDRWRRVEEVERRQAEQLQRNQAAASAAAAGAAAGIPPPPPGPPPSALHAAPSNISMPPVPPPNVPYGASSITSPGTYTGTEASADYANNRRRRRAERAQTRARQQQQQHSVEFT